jgi:hypothetical protein
MIRISERLSEFSYGYGVVEETRRLLEVAGWNVVPFLPNLVHEQEVGFDVAFSMPGAVLMLQFKLGDQLSRFRRSYPTQLIPTLAKPFWRFQVNTGEHQFLRLWSSEVLGAEVYYVAPRFADWTRYEMLFRTGRVMEESLLITPSEIKNATPGPTAEHRIVYDHTRRYVCSDPVETPDLSANDLLKRIAARGAKKDESLAYTINRLANERPEEQAARRLSSSQRNQLRQRARTSVEGDAAVFALEAWLQGAQTIFVGHPLED